MHKTRYELENLYDRELDLPHTMRCNLPMNTPLMLVRSGRKLVLKRLKMPHRPRIHSKPNDNQVSLL